jgi:TPP-dependent 2-oxoacid decarboxylase
MSQLIRFKEGTPLGDSYTNREVSISAGGTRKVDKAVATAMLKSYPDFFELVSDDNEQSEPKEEESSLEDSSDPDGVSSDVKSRILSILENSSDPMKITGIADELSVSWQSIRSDIQSLVNVGAVDKSDDNLYSV